MDLVDLAVSAAPGAILGALTGGIVAELRGHRAEAREGRRRARDRARDWDLKRIADTRGQFGLEIRRLSANLRGDRETEAELAREMDRVPFPDNDVRILGAEAHPIMADLFRLSSLHGDEREVRAAADHLDDRVWSVTNELRDRAQRDETLELVELTLAGFPEDVRRRFVSRGPTAAEPLGGRLL
jgi:hypothetical protein